MNNIELLDQLLKTIETDILEKTRQSVTRGNGVFGAAILRKSDLSLVIADANNEVDNPMLHGEVNVIKSLWEREDRAELPKAKDCIFLSSHEPCSLCLSAITWSGFDNFYYFFSYEQTRDLFKMPHDIQILQDVFGGGVGDRPFYHRQNSFWSSYNIQEMINNLDEKDQNRERLIKRSEEIIKLYIELSNIYEADQNKPVVYEF